MKKIICLLLLFFGVMFVGVIDAMAIDCKTYEYACAECVYEYYNESGEKQLSFTYEIYADEDGVMHKDYYPKEKSLGGRYKEFYNDHTTIQSFIKTYDNNDWLVCRSSLYTTADAQYEIGIYPSYTSGMIELKINGKAGFNNNKKISNGITCEFKAKANGAGGTVTATITSDGDKILSQQYSRPYEPNPSSADKFAKYFKDSYGKLVCPSDAFYISCGGYNGNYYCSLVEGSDIRGNTNSGTQIDGDGNPVNNTDVPNVEPVEQNCKSMFGDPDDKGTPAYYLSFAFKLIKYIAILVLIIFSILDFVKAVTAQDNDALKKAVSNTLLRLVLCAVIFVLPILIKLLLTIMNDKAMEICINTNM